MKMKRKAKARVAIARDVLETLDIKKRDRYMVRRSNGYVEIDKIPKGWKKEDLETLLARMARKRKCSVCGLGAMFISLVKLYDNIAPVDVLEVEKENDALTADGEHIYKELSRYFKREDLEAIEHTFEHSRNGSGEDLLRGICVSIVDNKGRYTGEDL